MKRTYIIFETKAQREKALDFLTRTNIKYLCNVSREASKPCWLSFSPKTFIKNCIDLYLDGLYVNSFTQLPTKK
jgi:hypothetical protein